MDGSTGCSQQAVEEMVADCMREPAEHILVLGDNMVDVWVEVEMVGVSQDANVARCREVRRMRCPGGAANVHYNLTRLVPGKNVWGSWMGAFPGAFTPIRRTRYLCGGRQVLRVDSAEDMLPPAKKILACADVLVISDYNKGAVHAGALPDVAPPQGIFVDSKNPTKIVEMLVEKYGRGMYAHLYMFPNEAEYKSHQQQYNYVVACGGTVVVKCGARGAMVMVPGKETLYVATQPKQGCTCGAGDVFMAAFVAERLHGNSIAHAAVQACNITAAAIEGNVYTVRAKE